MPRLESDRLATFYIHFLMVNGGAIVPVFDDPHDKIALAKLQELLPEREVVGVLPMKFC